MVHQRTLFAVSIGVSLLLHGVLLIVAPYVSLFEASFVPKEFMRLLEVRLLESWDETRFDTSAEASAARLTSRAGALKELLDRETEKLTPEGGLSGGAEEIPRLSERLGAVAIEREYDVMPAPASLEVLDTRIIEISQETARRDIQIARRLVTPSTTRILPEGDMPVLRSATESHGEDVLVFEPSGVGSGSGRDFLAEAREPVRERLPSTEEIRTAPASFIETPWGLPELPEERNIARAPVVNEIRAKSSFEFLDDLVNIQMDAFVPPGDKKGFFRLCIEPKAEGKIEILPKDVTLVIDASGSIQQRKLDQTVVGMKGIIARSLREGDRFNIVIFRAKPTSFRPAPVEVTPETRAEALKFLSGLQSGGETDVYGALEPVMRQEIRPGIPAIVLVATDGRPTAGVRDARAIINGLTADNQLRNTVFAYGGGKTVNRYLMDLLAYRNKGEARYSELIDSMGRELPQFFARLGEPILVDCVADYGNISEEEVFPKQIPDFFKGRAVTVYGRFDPVKDREFVMRLTGRAGPRKKEIVFKADLTRARAGDPEMAREWAFRKAYYLIGEICRVGETPELLAELRRLSDEYRIRTSYSQ